MLLQSPTNLFLKYQFIPISSACDNGEFGESIYYQRTKAASATINPQRLNQVTEFLLASHRIVKT